MVTVSPDGRWLATGTDNGTVKVYDLRTGQVRWRFAMEQARGLTSNSVLEFDSKSKTLAARVRDEEGRLDLRTGDLRFKNYAPGPPDKRLSPDGKLRLVETRVKDQYAWKYEIVDASTGKKRLTLPLTKYDQVEFLSDSRHVLTLAGKEVQLWAVAKSKPLWVWSPPDRAWHLFRYWASPDGRLLAVYEFKGQGYAKDPPGRAIRWLDVATGKERGRWAVEESIDSLVFSPDGKCVTWGNVVWDVPSGKERLRLGARHGKLSPIGWTPDSRTLITASNNCVQLWRVPAP
jgi:hypothetical protein